MMTSDEDFAELLSLPKTPMDPDNFDIGIIIAKFQTPRLTTAHRALLDYVSKRHNKVIVLLGVARVLYLKPQPLDYPTRVPMIQTACPNAVIMPVFDMISDEDWSKQVDRIVKSTFGERSALLYGSRDSFIPYYHGKFPTQELDTKIPDMSGTALRREASRTIINSDEYRTGFISAILSTRDVTYPTVDVAAINSQGKLLLGRKAGETAYRFVGGFHERTEEDWEATATKEFHEETGSINQIKDLFYMASNQIAEGRYKNSGSGIGTTLFIGRTETDTVKPADDIAYLEWVDFPKADLDVESYMVPEHVLLMKKFLKNFYGPRLEIHKQLFPEIKI